LNDTKKTGKAVISSMPGKFGVAVIGLGRIGESHLDGIRQNPDKAFTAAMVDIDAAKQSAASHHPVTLNL